MRRIKSSLTYNPVRRRAQRSRRRSDWCRRILGRQQPGNGEQADGEEKVEEEKHGRGNDSRSLVRHRGRTSQYRHTASLTDNGEKHEFSTADAVDNPDRDERRKEVGDAVEAGEEERDVPRETNRGFEDDCSVDCQLTGEPGHFRQGLPGA